MDENITRSLDRCFISDSHYDISVICYELFKDKFKYTGKNIWVYLKDNQWLIDKKTYKLINFIQTTVCNAFIERALYWNSSIESDIFSFDKRLIAEKLLQICNKLKNYNYVSVIIRESKQFFDIQ